MLRNGWGLLMVSMALAGCGDTSSSSEDAGRVVRTDTGPGTLPTDSGTPGGGTDGGTAEVLPAWQWDHVLDAAGGFDQGRAIAVASTGHIVVVGPYAGALQFDGTSYPSQGDKDIFVARFMPDGTPDWIRTFGSDAYDSCRSVAIDAGGNIYLAGQYSGAGMTIAEGAPLPYAVDNGKDIFVASLDATGAHRWSHGYGGPGTDSGDGIAVQGELVVAVGFFQQTVSLPSEEVTSAGESDIFVLGMNRSGVTQWQRTFGGPENDQALGVAMADNDKAYVVGHFGGTVTFGEMGGKAAISTTASDLFVLKINSDGLETQFAQFGGSETNTIGRHIAITDERGVVVAGKFNGTLSFPGTSLTSVGTDGVLIRLNNTLEHRWHRVLPATGRVRVRGLAWNDGQVYTIGQYTETFTPDAVEMTSVGADDVFIAAYADGVAGATPLWAQTYGSPGLDWGLGVAVHGDLLYATGALRGDTDFGGGVRTIGDDGEVFLFAQRVR